MIAPKALIIYHNVPQSYYFRTSPRCHSYRLEEKGLIPDLSSGQNVLINCTARNFVLIMTDPENKWLQFSRHKRGKTTNYFPEKLYLAFI
jgi:hypothetical protein